MPRGQMPSPFFAEDTYVIAPQKPAATLAPDDRWLSHEPEGQLSLDVFEGEDAVIITAPIAGVKPEDLEIFVSNDLITIRGRREKCVSEEGGRFLYQECYWGAFSRSIILPVHVASDKTTALLKNGVLTITLPRETPTNFIPVSEIYE